MPSESTTKKPIDSTIEVVAPENVAFNYRLAGLFKRAFAFAIDSVCIGVYVGGFGFVLTFLASGLVEYLYWDEKIVEQFASAAFLLNSMFAFWFWNAWAAWGEHKNCHYSDGRFGAWALCRVGVRRERPNGAIGGFSGGNSCRRRRKRTSKARSDRFRAAGH